ncbi:hypothetical protein DRN75_00915 [Nanoarchaeota archaeon]|nr:MAG: hypothetical protein DRN75_00915 [Nanoarchaeota archaeon]
MYLIFEGADNVGKTTLIKAVAARIPCIVVKEPGGRQALINEGFEPKLCGKRYPSFRGMVLGDPWMPENARRAAFLADSLYQWEAVTKPLLDAGVTVLSDRSWISDLAYGSVLSNLSISDLYAFNNLLMKRDKGHVIYLHLPAEERAKRHSVINLMDKTDQGALDTAYRQVFSSYFRKEEVTELCTIEPVEVLVEKVLGLLSDSSSV